MQQEISFGEIIHNIWNGKRIILIITCVAVLLSVLANYFIISPQYRATAGIRVEGKETDDEKDSVKLQSYSEIIKSDQSLSKLLDKLQLDSKVYSVNSLKNSIKIESIKEANTIKVTVTGTNSTETTRIANQVISDLAATIEINDRSGLVVEAKNQLKTLNDKISISAKVVSEAKKQLESIPLKITTNKSLTDDPALQQIISQSSGKNALDLSALLMASENINPVYININNKVAEESINLETLQQEKIVNENKVTENEKRIAELSKLDGYQESDNKEQNLDGIQALALSRAIEPKTPIKPNKVVNIFLTGIIVFILSCLIVIAKYQLSNPVRNSLLTRNAGGSSSE